MAGSPLWKIYSSLNEYMGCTKYVEDAAAFVAHLGEGATIRNGHSPKAIVWREGAEAFPAGQSYDGVSHEIIKRISRRQNEAA